MDIRTKVIAVLTAGILAAAPIVAFALTNYTLNGNYTITGTLQVDTLAASQCVATNASKQLVSSGAACGGGGGGAVSSVTSSNANLTAAPTTGAVILGFSAAPTFAGNTTVGSLTSAGAANVGSVNASGAISGATLLGTGLSSGDCVQASTGGLLTTTGAACAAGGGVTSVTSTTPLALTASPTTGAVSIAIPTSPIFGGNVTVGQLSSSGSVTGSILGAANLNTAGCAAVNNGNQIIGTGVPCGTNTTQTQHGNQSITAVAAACTSGTAIVFTTPFTAVPDIIMSTSAVVGDTAAPETGTITTTGFTPEICSVASAATATVYWNAVN